MDTHNVKPERVYVYMIPFTSTMLKVNKHCTLLKSRLFKIKNFDFKESK